MTFSDFSTIFSKKRKQTLDSVGSAISEMNVISPCLTTCLGTKASEKLAVANNNVADNTIAAVGLFIFQFWIAAKKSESVFNGLELQLESKTQQHEGEEEYRAGFNKKQQGNYFHIDFSVAFPSYKKYPSLFMNNTYFKIYVLKTIVW